MKNKQTNKHPILHSSRVMHCVATLLFVRLFVCCMWMGTFFRSANRPPERRHGYEQQFVASVSSQPEHESLEAKRQRVEGPSETHFTRAPTGTIVLPLPHVMQDGIRSAAGDVKKVRHNCQHCRFWHLKHYFSSEVQNLFLLFADKVQ